MKIKSEEFKSTTKTSCIRWYLGNFNICMSYPLHIILFSEYREMARYTSLQYVVSFLIHSSRPFVTLIHLSFLEGCMFHLSILSNKTGSNINFIDTRYNVLDVNFTLLVRYKLSTWSEILPRYFLSI